MNVGDDLGGSDLFELFVIAEWLPCCSGYARAGTIELPADDVGEEVRGRRRIDLCDGLKQAAGIATMILSCWGLARPLLGVFGSTGCAVA